MILRRLRNYGNSKTLWPLWLPFVLVALAAGAYQGTVKLSQITSGGAFVNSTDQIVVVRSGNSDRLVTMAAGVINVQDRGVKPANSAGTNDTAIAAIITALAATPAQGGAIYFPTGTYSISASIDVSSLRYINIIGEGWFSGSPYGSVLTGTIAGPMVSANWGSGAGTFRMFGMNVRNSSTNAAASCLYMVNGNKCQIDWCQFFCPNWGVYDNGSFTTTISDCDFNGSGNVAIGLLIHTGGGALISGGNFNGLLEGIRAAGGGIRIIGGRFETNKTAMRLGALTDGTNSNFDAGTVFGGSFEANDYGVYCQVCTNCNFGGLTIPSTANAPSGAGIIGIDILGCSYCTFDACNCNGTYSTTGINISGNNHITLRNCESTSWTVTSSLTALSFLDCNNTGFGRGQPVILAAANVTAQSAAATIVSCTTPAADGDYEVSAQVIVTAAAAISTTVAVTYTDKNNGAQTMVLPLYAQAGTPIATGTIIATGTYETPVMHIGVKASTAITTKLTTGTFTTVTWQGSSVIKQNQ